MYMYDHIGLNSYSNEKFFRKFVEKIKTQSLYSTIFFENRTFYEIMWKIWPMSLACWIPKTTDTKCLIPAFPRQQ